MILNSILIGILNKHASLFVASVAEIQLEETLRTDLIIIRNSLHFYWILKCFMFLTGHCVYSESELPNLNTLYNQSILCSLSS